MRTHCSFLDLACQTDRFKAFRYQTGRGHFEQTENVFVDVVSSSACPNVLDCGRETPALHARHRLLVILRRRAARGGGVLSLDR
jgi:hypothetical protein